MRCRSYAPGVPCHPSCNKFNKLSHVRNRASLNTHSSWENSSSNIIRPIHEHPAHRRGCSHQCPHHDDPHLPQIFSIYYYTSPQNTTVCSPFTSRKNHPLATAPVQHPVQSVRHPTYRQSSCRTASYIFGDAPSVF